MMRAFSFLHACLQLFAESSRVNGGVHIDAGSRLTVFADLIATIFIDLLRLMMR